MAERVTDDDLELLNALGVDTAPKATGGRTAKEQRIIAGFEEISRFVEEHGRVPQHGEDRDIFERIYAVRLGRLRELAECRELLQEVDTRGLLTGVEEVGAGATDEELLAALGVEAQADEVTQLKHVRSHADRKAPEEVAERIRCADFDTFRPVFEHVQQELSTRLRGTAKFSEEEKIKVGDLFILDGQKVLVAGAGDVVMKEFGREDRRLRVIYDNGTESNLLLRSLQRGLHKDEHGRRIMPRHEEALPLFADQLADEDSQAGLIYVLRSKSEHPFVVEHRKLLHKIGVTGGEVKSRVANARKDPTYLLAAVEVVAEYKLANVNRQKLEAMLHKFFSLARLDLELKDRFGFQVEPREWFLVPLPAIDEAIRRITDGSISGFRYDLATASITPDS